MKYFLLTGAIILSMVSPVLATDIVDEYTRIPEGVEVVDYDEDTDYLDLMLACAEDGSTYALTLGAIYEEQRNLKLADAGEEDQTDFFSIEDADELRAALEAYATTSDDYVMYYTEDDVTMLAKILYRECGGIASDTEKACVAWCVLNRVDATEGSSIYSIITAPGQFAYYRNTSVDDDLYALALDVLERWNLEKNGVEEVGRVLPSDYLWFSGNGRHNYFRNAFSGGTTWNYSLPSPYAS